MTDITATLIGDIMLRFFISEDAESLQVAMSRQSGRVEPSVTARLGIQHVDTDIRTGGPLPPGSLKLQSFKVLNY